MSSDKPVIVYIELNDKGEVLPVSLECIAMGRKLAGIMQTSLNACIIGNNIDNAVEEARHCNIDKIFTLDDTALDQYHPELFKTAFCAICNGASPGAILMGHTLQSIDLAPRVAYSLSTGLITDCVDIVKSDEIEFIKPVYSSNVMAAYTIEKDPYMATIRTRTIDQEPKTGEPCGDVIQVEADIDKTDVGIEVLERFIDKNDGPKLEHAGIVVAGGRGIGGPEGFENLAALAEQLNAAVGASRPPCDLGWINPTAQVGQTGELVGPSANFAIGISGSTQHIAGMSASKTIVAINKDAGANIFSIADYGAVGNYEEILPGFREALK